MYPTSFTLYWLCDPLSFYKRCHQTVTYPSSFTLYWLCDPLSFYKCCHQVVKYPTSGCDVPDQFHSVLVKWPLEFLQILPSDCDQCDVPDQALHQLSEPLWYSPTLNCHQAVIYPTRLTLYQFCDPPVLDPQSERVSSCSRVASAHSTTCWRRYRNACWSRTLCQAFHYHFGMSRNWGTRDYRRHSRNWGTRRWSAVDRWVGFEWWRGLHREVESFVAY